MAFVNLPFTVQVVCARLQSAEKYRPLPASSADRCGFDVRCGLHGRRGGSKGHSNDRQLPAVPPPQTVALWPALHESVQRGKCHITGREIQKVKAISCTSCCL